MEAQPFGASSAKIRSLVTADIDELAQFQVNKNRRYTQLQPGVLNGDYAEVNLGDVQIFRESLTAGALIEAAPVASFVPFATVFPDSEDFSFCGKKRQQHSLLQGTGGSWDASFKNNLKFAVAAFSRESFNLNLQRLMGCEIPAEWLISKAVTTDERALNDYAFGLDRVINLVHRQPHLLNNQSAQRMIGATILRLALNTLMPTITMIEKPIPRPLRIQGVRRVIDYLHSHAHQLPTIPELCEIAQLSERNLQYGFREYLGVTPIRYLRLVRLNGVKRDLLMANPKTDRVVDVALNWGFVELGRFAGEYRQLFNELPSETLNKDMN